MNAYYVLNPVGGQALSLRQNNIDACYIFNSRELAEMLIKKDRNPSQYTIHAVDLDDASDWLDLVIMGGYKQVMYAVKLDQFSEHIQTLIFDVEDLQDLRKGSKRFLRDILEGARATIGKKEDGQHRHRSI